jgi:rare lipoprotein A
MLRLGWRFGHSEISPGWSDYPKRARSPSFCAEFGFNRLSAWLFHGFLEAAKIPGRPAIAFAPADRTKGAIAVILRSIAALSIQILLEHGGRSAMIRLHVIVLLLMSVFILPALASLEVKAHTGSIRRNTATIQVGTASWYGRGHAGRITASGEPLNPRAMTCAHRTLPFGSVVKVTDIANGKHVSLRVNDRGPYVKGRILDLSEGAAKELGISNRGLMIVRIEIVSIANALAPG